MLVLSLAVYSSVVIDVYHTGISQLSGPAIFETCALILHRPKGIHRNLYQPKFVLNVVSSGALWSQVYGAEAIVNIQLGEYLGAVEVMHNL